MRTGLLAILVVGCGNQATPAPSLPVQAAPTAHEPPPAVAASRPFAEIRERSSCAFESSDALCAAFREHLTPHEGGWVSEDCALGPRRTTSGDFAEALLVGVRKGDGDAGGTRVVRQLLGGTVRQPDVPEGTTNVVLAARVGSAWFPLVMFGAIRGEVDPARLDWSLDPSGDTIAWTDREGGSLDDPYGYGRVERTIAVVDRGVPVIAARATIDAWNGDVDLTCTRACNQGSSPPPADCDRQCSARARATRTWEVSAGVVRIGESQVVRTGAAAERIEVPIAPAETHRLDAADPQMMFCAFMPVVHALPRTTVRTDAASVAARDRAREILGRGTARELPGAIAAARSGAPRSIVAIDGQVGGACGGGACTVSLLYRTVDGTMPEQGVSYVVNERGPRVGCDDAAMPAGRPTLVEVAPARSRAAVGCGFIGWDGTTEHVWVIVRVLEGAR